MRAFLNDLTALEIVGWFLVYLIVVFPVASFLGRCMKVGEGSR